jgi:hypothetical protein
MKGLELWRWNLQALKREGGSGRRKLVEKEMYCVGKKTLIERERERVNTKKTSKWFSER